VLAWPAADSPKLEDDDETYPVYAEEMLNRLSLILCELPRFAEADRQ
jgi:hypothetical protein